MNKNVPSTVLVHEIRRCFHRYGGTDAPLESIRGRIGVQKLFLSRTLRLEFDTGVRDIPLKSAHVFD